MIPIPTYHFNTQTIVIVSYFTTSGERLRRGGRGVWSKLYDLESRHWIF